MKRYTYYAPPLENLIATFTKFPGVGPKTAQRFAFHLLQSSKEEVTKLAKTIQEMKESIRHCTGCYNLTTQDPCSICQDPARNPQKLCVVAEVKDLIALERMGEFKGRYHVLGGMISPLDGIGPEQLRIQELLIRLEKEPISEVILATNPTVEGEATNLYLIKLIKPFGRKITRIASGLPVGSDMDYADPVTLIRSFEGRQEV